MHTRAAQHLVVDIVRVMAAFTNHMETPHYPAEYYEWVNSPLDVTKTAVYCTVTLISDALIVSALSRLPIPEPRGREAGRREERGEARTRPRGINI